MNSNLIFSEIEEHFKKENLLSDPSKWKSIDVDYHPPHVERLYTNIGSIRVCLHKIHPCDPDEALLHPHPWPASFKVYKGMYLTEIGSSSTSEPPKESVKVNLSAGSMISMTNPNDWHYVAPIDEPVYTMMINGAPYEKTHPGVKKASKKLFPLKEFAKEDLLREFKKLIHDLPEPLL